MEVILKNRKKKFSLEAKKCGKIWKFLGLMLSRREKAKILLFEFKKPTHLRLHSLFVFFPFVVLWLNKENEIIGSEIVRPFRFSVRIPRKFFKIVEIPINKKNRKTLKKVEILVGRKI